MLAAGHFYQPGVWSCHCCPSPPTPCHPHTTVPAPSSSSSASPCTRLLAQQHSPNLLRSPLPPTRLPNHRHPKAAGTPAGKCSPKLVSLRVSFPSTARRGGAGQHCAPPALHNPTAQTAGVLSSCAPLFQGESTAAWEPSRAATLLPSRPRSQPWLHTEALRLPELPAARLRSALWFNLVNF